MLTITKGNIFNSDMQTLVNPVNCVGVMGAGLALKFKQMYPDMFAEYRKLCAAGMLRVGHPYLYSAADCNKQILLFPTKNHWRDASKMEYITDGLDWFINNYEKAGITSVAFPALGCGYGNLSWDQVGWTIVKKLHALDILVEMYWPK